MIDVNTLQICTTGSLLPNDLNSLSSRSTVVRSISLTLRSSNSNHINRQRIKSKRTQQILRIRVDLETMIETLGVNSRDFRCVLI